nr:immunoglobulin heavy chain junction region [Mus musculus]
CVIDYDPAWFAYW